MKYFTVSAFCHFEVALYKKKKMKIIYLFMMTPSAAILTMIGPLVCSEAGVALNTSYTKKLGF